MNFEVREEGRQTILAVHGNLCSGHETETFRDKLAELLSNGKRLVVLDFTHLGSIDSHGIGKLLLFFKKFRDAGGRLQISTARENVENIFRGLMLDHLFRSDMTQPHRSHQALKGQQTN